MHAHTQAQDLHACVESRNILYKGLLCARSHIVDLFISVPKSNKINSVMSPPARFDPARSSADVKYLYDSRVRDKSFTTTSLPSIHPSPLLRSYPLQLPLSSKANRWLRLQRFAQKKSTRSSLTRKAAKLEVQEVGESY